MTPLKRFINLLNIDKKDIYQIFFYAIISGVISLSLPLGIQAIINFIQSGGVSTSWIVLVCIVIIGVFANGYMSLMQLRITENLQQKIFVRSAFDFALRLPKIKYEAQTNAYPPELANRFFDTISIQKGTSKLLIDFSAALLQIIFGLLLLSVYHTFFLIFGILLMLLLYLIFRLSYRPGLESSMNESKYKYKVAGWLQEIARNQLSFRNENHHEYGLRKNDNLVNEYLSYREKHFSVIKKQFNQLVWFKTFITASLLIIGGFLVLGNQMNIGQFIAAEIIILLVINSVEKIILGLETFYDILTSIEKIGQVTDMDLENDNFIEHDELVEIVNIEAEKIMFNFKDSNENTLSDITLKISQGEKILINGENGSGKSTLIRILSGMIFPTFGNLLISDDTFRKLDIQNYRKHIGCVFNGDSPFEGSIYDNLTLGNKEITSKDLKEALDAVQLSGFIKSLPTGLETIVNPEGKQLSSSNAQKILLARAILSKPKVLFLETPTEKIDGNTANEIIDYLTDIKHNWTIVVTSKNKYWKNKVTRKITMSNGKIKNDINITPNA